MNLSYYLENIVQAWASANYTDMFIHTTNTVYPPDTVVVAGDTVVGKTRHGPCTHETCSLVIRTNIKQIMFSI